MEAPDGRVPAAEGGPSGGAQRPDSREPSMTWARQLFSTKLAWDERATQLHAVNSIEEAFCTSVVAYAAKLSPNFLIFRLCTLHEEAARIQWRRCCARVCSWSRDGH